jgi:hypothetical protein
MGETSDFGGRGPLSPCEQSEVVGTPVDAAEARQRGFGTSVDRLERDFSSELGWTIRESPVRAVGADAYLSRTTFEGTMRLRRLVLLTPALAGCEPRLAVTVDASLRTGDGALMFAGPLYGTFTKYERPAVGTPLDASALRATLSAVPGLNAARMVGTASLIMELWPDSVRGLISVILAELGSRPTPEGGVRGELLEGIFPIDDCPSDSAPLEPATPSPALAGLSPNQVNERLNMVLHQRMPTMARWQDGREVTLSFGTGSPLRNVCVREVEGATGSGLFFYDAPLLIKSADGRVNIEGSAYSHVQISKGGAIEKASLEIDIPDHAMSQEELASVAGISGVDLGGAKYLYWRAELQLKDTGQELACRGTVGVEGSNIPNVLDPIAKLTWGPQPGFP